MKHLTTTNKVVLAGEVRGPEIKKEEIIQKVRNCIKDIGYDQDGFTWKEATKIESRIFIHNQQILLWELIQKATKMKELVIKV